MASHNSERNGNRGDTPAAQERARAVRRYLSALDMQRPGRSAAKTSESILHRIHHVDTLLMSADPVSRLHLTQERIDLHAEQLRIAASPEPALAEFEEAFVRAARSYGERHGLTYSAWRQIGVNADVLERAGIIPTKSPRATKPTEAPIPTDASP
ncbi:MAG TPA: hypothetical protein VNB24_00425 [Acidimicrobiales bacterium]|nr:hypothetical protein [Acidimicrobiales bacterium]